MASVSSFLFADNQPLLLNWLAIVSLPQYNSLTSHRCLDLGSKSCLLGKVLLLSPSVSSQMPSSSPYPTAQTFLSGIGSQIPLRGKSQGTPFLKFS